MAIHTFSTKGSKPEDTKLVEDCKKFCQDHHLNFSGLVVNLLKQWKEQNGTKVQSDS